MRQAVEPILRRDDQAHAMADQYRRDGQAPITAAGCPSLRLVARTQHVGVYPNPDGGKSSHSLPPPFFTSAQWTADGTTAFAVSSDQRVHAYVLPDDLLEDTADCGRCLTPQASTKLPEPTQIAVTAPYFSLRDPATQTFLSACRDHPIHLRHVFPDGPHTAPLATYKLIRTETEEFIAPSALLWQYPGTHFLCGSANRLDLFDASGHPSAGPVVTVPTSPSRRQITQESGVGMKGIVSALSATQPDAGGSSIIAAGTWSRMVGLYDLHRTDKTIANWSISQAAKDSYGKDLGGRGVAQTMWSPCGRYLVINERHATRLLVYDVRVTGQLLSILQGREAHTQQRMHADVFTAENGGFEVWAGSQDGRVHVWDDVGLHGNLDARPSWGWEAHQSPVGSTALHPSGSVAATCSGGWEHPRAYEYGGSDASSSTVLDESSLRLWSIEAATSRSPETSGIDLAIHSRGNPEE